MTKQRETFDQVVALHDEVRPRVAEEVIEVLRERHDEKVLLAARGCGDRGT